MKQFKKIAEKDVNSCDVSNTVIDFSLTNHVSQAFSNFIEYSLRSSLQKVFRSVICLCSGIISGFMLALLGIILFIKVFGVENSFFASTSKNYISQLFNTNNVSLKSVSLRFNDKNSLCLYINGLSVNNVQLPELCVVPSCFQSLMHMAFISDTVEIVNANLKLMVDKKSNKIYVQNNFVGDHNKGNRYISISHFRNLLRKIGGAYRFNNATINLTKGKDKYYFTKVSGVLDKDFNLNELTFDTYLNNNSESVCISLTQYSNTINAYLKNVQSEDLSKFIRDKELRFLQPLATLVDYAKLPISGNVTFEKNGNTLRCKDFKITSGAGSIINKNSSVMSTKIGQHIDGLDISGSFDRDNILIDNIDIYKKGTHMKMTGIKMGTNGCELDGTIELCNITKTDLMILPKPITNLCLTLFDKKLDNFKLSSLKLDVQGRWSDNTAYKMNVSHGIFQIKGGSLALGNKMVNGISASGEVINDTVKLNIHSATIDGDVIDGGTIKLSSDGHCWNGTISMIIPTEKFINQLNIFKNCTIPFDKFNLQDVVRCNLVIQNGDHGFKILSGEGQLKANSGVLNVLWDQNKAKITGTIADTTIVEVNIDLLNNKGEKKLVISDDNKVLSSISDIFGSFFKGKYQCELSEKWSGARGVYDIKVNLKGTKVVLPIVGDIKKPEDDGLIVGKAVIDGSILRFNSIKIDSKDVHISGDMVVDRSANRIISCNFFNSDHSVVCNLKRSANNQVKMNLIGQYLDFSHVLSVLNNIAPDTETVISAKVDHMKINEIYNVHKIKGRVTVRDGRIINGGMCCSLSNGSSVVLDADMIDNSSVVHVNVADAGQFLKEIDIADSVTGGKLKMTIASDLSAKQTMYAVNCELSDVLVKNNRQLAKLVSLSTASNVDASNFLVGFNGVVCSLTMKDNSVTINDGRAIGPMLCLSFSGDYNRLEDNLKLEGIAVPVNFYANGKSLYSSFGLSGALSVPEISVNPVSSTNRNLLSELFGINLFDNDMTGIKIEDTKSMQITPISKQLEERYVGAPVDLDKVNKSETSQKTSKKSAKSKHVYKDNSLGITVTRGV